MNVHYSTADGTATVADDDYQPADNTITFIAGQQSQTVTVNVVGDTKFEQDEYFFVNWSSGPGGFIPGHQSAVTIVNDDPKPPKTCGLPRTGSAASRSTRTTRASPKATRASRP